MEKNHIILPAPNLAKKLGLLREGSFSKVGSSRTL